MTTISPRWRRTLKRILTTSGTSNRLSITISIRKITRLRMAMATATWDITGDTATFPATACCGNPTLRARGGIRSWMARGPGIRAWDSCGLRRIRGAGCLTTTGTGCLFLDLAGDGSLVAGTRGGAEFITWA